MAAHEHFKEDLLKFYRTFVKRSPTRRKLSSQVLSTCDEEKRQKKNKQAREKGVKYFPPQAENELRLSQSEFDRQVKKQQEAK